MRQPGVRILNPIPGSSGYCSVKRALKYIRQGRGRAIDEQTIEIFENDRRHLAALRSALEPAVERLNPPVRTPPTPDPVYEYRGPENLRTFAHYPAPNDFRSELLVA